MSSVQKFGGDGMGRGEDRILTALRMFLKGDGDGAPLITMEEWVTGIIGHTILGKYPLHIFTFLPQCPAPESMTHDERIEISLTIAEAFFDEKLAPPRLRMIARMATSDRALKYYLYAVVRNWVIDKIHVAAKTDDQLFLGMKIEKTLRSFPDVFVEIARADNWRESLWTLLVGIGSRRSLAGALDDFRQRTRAIAEIASPRSTGIRYRRRLISTAALSQLLRDIFSAVNEPMSIFELLAIAKTKISVPATSFSTKSLDADMPDSELTLMDTIADPSTPSESQLIDQFDLPSCAARFLGSLDHMDLEILRELLDAAFATHLRSVGQVAQIVMKKLNLAGSTYYFRKERLSRRLADVLSEQDEMLFYQEIRKQLESEANVMFPTDRGDPDPIVSGQRVKVEKN